MSLESSHHNSHEFPDTLSGKKENVTEREKTDIAVSDNLVAPEAELTEKQAKIEHQRKTIRYALLGAFNEEFWNAVPITGTFCSELIDDIPSMRKELSEFLEKRIESVLAHRDIYEKHAHNGDFDNALKETRKTVNEIISNLDRWKQEVKEIHEKIPANILEDDESWWTKFVRANERVLEEAENFKVFEMFLKEEKPRLIDLNTVLQEYLKFISNIGAFSLVRKGKLQLKTSFSEKSLNTKVKVNEILEVFLLTSLHSGKSVMFEGVMNIRTDINQKEIIITFSTSEEINEEEITLYGEGLSEKEAIRKWLLNGNIYSLMAYAKTILYNESRLLIQIWQYFP